MKEATKKFVIISAIVLGITSIVLNICFGSLLLSKKTSSDIFEDNILKVVEIKVSDDEETWGYATGFFIDKKGGILTNKHVVTNSLTNENYGHIYVRTADREGFIEATVEKISEVDDLALIRVDLNNTKFFKLSNAIENGTNVYTIGNPNGFGLSYTSGVVSINSRDVIYNGSTIHCFQTSLVINEGNSGGPVFNEEGKLLGIISFRLKDKNNEVIQACAFALPSSTISNFIKY